MKKLYSGICIFFILCTAGKVFADESSLMDILFPEQHAGWVTIDLGLASRPVSEYFGGGLGLTADFGLNFARPFSDKTIFAPFVGIEVTWGNKWSDSFINDLNDSYTRAADPNSHGDMSDEDYWSLSEAQNTVLEPMLKGKTDGTCMVLRYGGVIGLPWRYVPVVRVYGQFTSIGVTSSGDTVQYTDGTTGGGSTYGPWIPGWGADMEIFRGFSLMSDSAGSIYMCCIRAGFEVSNIGKAQVVEEDDIDGVRKVTMSEFVNSSFENKYSDAWAITLAFTLISAR